MKRCPTCDKTFEDSMRFCQTDGTPLVDDAPPLDPYATIVGMPPPVAEPEEAAPEQASEPEASETPAEDAPAEMPAEEVPAEEVATEAPADAPDAYPTVGSLPISEPEDVLDLPEADPLKTMYVSEAEMASVLEPAAAASEPLMDLPEIEETPAPEPPSFTVPDVPAPSFGDMSPPPSPFSPSESAPEDQPMTAPPVFVEPEPVRDEAETLIQPQPAFDPPPAAPAAEWAPPPAPVAEWTPPPAPEAAWQNQEIGSNTPFQPPPAGVEGQSKGLAIASLVCGIASLICCSWFLVGAAAVVLGFIARGKVTSDPATYGGAGMAMAGMIMGGVSFLLGVIFWVLYLLGFMANLFR